MCGEVRSTFEFRSTSTIVISLWADPQTTSVVARAFLTQPSAISPKTLTFALKPNRRSIRSRAWW